jgi:hypothetical protein
MNIRASLHTVFSTPDAAFINGRDFLPAEREAFNGSQGKLVKDFVENPGTQSKKSTELRWRVDGCTAAGTQFFIIPLFSYPITPLRLDAVLLDASELPASLHGSLQLSSLCYMTNITGSKHPLIKKLIETLELFSITEELSHEKLERLPFGSEIQISGITSGSQGMHIELWPNYDLERKMLSLESLKKLWESCIPENRYPPALDIKDLGLVQQIQDSITVVRIRNMPSLGKLVFKSSTRGSHYLYHELKTLLSMPNHENVIGPPKFIVTKRCCFGGKIFVCGFILPFYPLASLRANLPHLQCNGSETLFALSVQICAALVHLIESGIYCSDLRPDNILLSNLEGSLKAVLIDFEQRGNWPTWSPPEIYNLEYMQQIMMSDIVPDKYKNYCLETLDAVGSDRTLRTQESEYYHMEGGCHIAWNTLSCEEQESAMVFLFGKLLWCIFEGIGTVNQFDLLWREGPETNDILEFPTFARTPYLIRELILDCTAGAPQHNGGLSAVIRRGDQIFRRGDSSSQVKESAYAEEVLNASKSWWQEELARMELFFGRPQLFADGRQWEELKEGYLWHQAPVRPKLRQVLQRLERLRQTHPITT